MASAMAFRVLNACPFGRRSWSRNAVTSNRGRRWLSTTRGNRSPDDIASVWIRKCGSKFTSSLVDGLRDSTRRVQPSVNLERQASSLG